MADLETFSTTILTNKTPEQSSSIVNEGIKNTNELIKTGLIPFFENYTKLIQKQNYDLNKLVNDQGVKITSILNQDSGNAKDYGTVVKVWDTFLNSVNFQTQTNDQLIKHIKLEVLSPLLDLINNDIKYSELLINNQELQELATAKTIDEYSWGSKALTILNNFGNFKKHERQLIIKSLVGIFNFNASQHSKGVRGNEEAVKYSLNGFDIDGEMAQYLNVLISSNPPPLKANSSSSSKPSHPVASGGGTTGSSAKPTTTKDKRQSKLFSNSKDKEKEERRKLRSRVGSIFARKKKSGKGGNDLDSIYSNQTTNTNLTNLKEEETPQPSPQLNQSSFHPPPSVATSGISQSNPSYHGDTHSMTSKDISINGNANATNGSRNPSGLSSSFEPLKPNSGFNRNPNRDLPILPSSPNVQKYGDDSSSGDEDLPQPAQHSELANSQAVVPPPPIDENEVINNHGKELDNGVGKPGLEEPPSIGSISGISSAPGSRTVSGNKETYSFESGDDTRFVASPKIERAQELPEPNIDQLPADAPSSAPAQNPSSQGITSSPPVPPPARRAHADRSEVKSQIFHSLPSARDSVVPSQFVPPVLTTQTTGTSIINKTDVFNHAELINHLVPGLNVSNSQIINVNFRQDSVTKASIIGEIAFHYSNNQQSNPPRELIVNLPNNTKTILNPLFLTKINDNDSNTSSLNVAVNPIINKTLGGIKYMDQNLKLSQIPILIHSIWKFENHQASLMINLKLNPSFGNSLVLKNLIVSVSLNSDVESTSASSRPTGTFNKDKNRITWRYNDIVSLNEANPDEKLIARFMTNGLASEDEQGIQVKFNVDDHLTGGIECDEGVNIVSNLIAGNYSCQS